ncbi:hypothetical protein GGI21_005566, partial [Coemansia aciculifera]
MGLSTDALQRDTLSLSWRKSAAGSNDQAIVRVSYDEYSGPWFAAHHKETSLALDSDHVLPFLHSELNLNKLAHSSWIQRHYCSDVPENEATLRMIKRDQLRSAQRIQKKIIMEVLTPVLVVAEDRVEYVDDENPLLRAVLRRNIRMVYKDCASSTEYSTSDGHACEWIEQLVDEGDSDASCTAEMLSFAVLEVHFERLGGLRPPEWLADLFFESGLVRPILDFDLYLHGIALLCPALVGDFPYWMVD